MNDITKIDTSLLPPELMLDRSHPVADEYIKNAQHVQRMIVATSALLKPKQVMAVKLRHTGENFVDIAEHVKVSPPTISKWLNDPTAKKLLALLTYYQAALDGPNEAQRRNMLWRVAVDNEIEQPKVTISAVAELNKMTITDYNQKNSGSGAGQSITLIINQESMPRTALDN
jgi:hypothetical protein